MDTIHITCPRCGCVFEVPWFYAGKRGRCARCKAILRVAAPAPALDDPPGPAFSLGGLGAAGVLTFVANLLVALAQAGWVVLPALAGLLVVPIAIALFVRTKLLSR